MGCLSSKLVDTIESITKIIRKRKYLRLGFFFVIRVTPTCTDFRTNIGYANTTVKNFSKIEITKLSQPLGAPQIPTITEFPTDENHGEITSETLYYLLSVKSDHFRNLARNSIIFKTPCIKSSRKSKNQNRTNLLVLEHCIQKKCHQIGWRNSQTRVNNECALILWKNKKRMSENALWSDNDQNLSVGCRQHHRSRTLLAEKLIFNLC
jgi:hypothetical protein